MAKGDQRSNRLRKSPFGRKYPYNRAFITRSGHEIHYDDTPGKERIRIAHKDGSYDEISVGGNRSQYTVGHNQQYNKGGVTITVDENQDIKIHGHQRMLVGGGSHVEIAGDASVVAGGNMNAVVGGNMKTAVSGQAYIGVGAGADINVVGGVNLAVDGSMSMKVSGDTTMETGGTHTIKASKIELN